MTAIHSIMDSTLDDDSSTLLTEQLQKGDTTTNYDAIFGEPSTNNKKYAKETVIGNVRTCTIT